MKWILTVAAAGVALAVGANDVEKQMSNVHEIEVQRITGETIKLKEYEGKALLVVNTASKCGFTSQYEGIQKLYAHYREQGLVVLGFPSNDFMKQEPGSDEEIQSFCKLNYGVSFPMFSKIKVKGSDQHPLYTYLTSKKTNPEFGGKISWNFNKFLISRNGKVVARFGSRTKPDDKRLISAIEDALEK